MEAIELHRDPKVLRGTRLLVGPAPEWVVRRKVKNYERQDGHPMTLLLVDRQIRPDEPARYTRYVRRLETPQAVQDAGKIELDFDPATQRLALHAISIFRNGELTNHADLDSIDIVQRERDLEKGIYAGGITALILLKDVRTGDIIDIEFSLLSDDQIFAGHYWFGENFEHTVPVAQQFFSWLAPDHERYQIQTDLQDLPLDEEETPWGLRKTWSRLSVPAAEVPNALPIGYCPFRRLHLSSFANWAEVASTYAELWEGKDVPSPELSEEIRSLRESCEGSELVEKLVAFVRDTIRYQGVEVGRLGQIPEDLATVWERRFGDCKEKTNMLCWALRECGFEATPALVSMEMQERVAELLPAPIFDHVVVHLTFEGNDHWIDPTNISQRGRLRTWNSLPFGKALLISHETTELRDIFPAPDKQNYLDVWEEYEFRGDEATLKVSHRYHGTEADQIRNALDSNGRSAAQQYFTEVVKSTRTKAELATDLEVSDDPEENKITMAADFKVPKALAPGGRHGGQVCEFVPHSIIGKIVGLNDKPQSHPLGQIHPLEIYHSTIVRHPDARGAIVPQTIIDNEWMTFNAGTRNEATQPEIFYKYRSKSPEVAIEDFGRYRLNLKQIGEVISLLFETRASTSSRSTANWQDEELSPTPRVRRTHQHRPAPAESNIPIWLIIVIVGIVTRVILWVMNP